MDTEQFVAQKYAEREFRHWLRVYLTTPTYHFQYDDLGAMVELVEGEALECGVEQLAIDEWRDEIEREVFRHAS